MANRFNNIYDNQYISTYVPLPFQEMVALGALKQGKQDEESAIRDQYLAKTWNRLGADAENARKIKSSIDQELENFSNKDFNDSQVRSNWYKTRMKLANEFGPDGAIGAQEASYNAHQAYVKDLDERLKKGDIDQSTRDLLINKSVKEYKGIGERGTTGYNTFRGETAANTADIPKYMDDLAKGWKENKVVNEGWTEDKDGKLYRMRGNEKEWISEDEIYKNIVPQAMRDANIQAFVNQQADLKTYGRENANELKSRLINDMYDTPGKYVANKYGYKQTAHKEEIQQRQDYLQRQKHKLDNPVFTTSTQSEALPGSLVEISDEIKDLEFNSDGSMKPIFNKETTSAFDSPTGLIGRQSKTFKKGNEINTEASEKAAAFITTLQNEHPELKGLNPKQTVEAYKKSIKTLEAESIPLQSISNVAAKNIGEALSRNKNQRNFYIYDGKGKTGDGQLSTVLKELDIKEEDFNKALANGISGYTQAGPSAGSYYLEVPDEDGETRRVMISPDTEMKKIFNTSQMVNEARKSFITTEVKPIETMPNYSIIVKPSISKDGTPSWSYTEVVKGKNGEILQSRPATLDDLRKAERKHLEESNYLGSELGVLKDNTTE